MTARILAPADTALNTLRDRPCEKRQVRMRAALATLALMHCAAASAGPCEDRPRFELKGPFEGGHGHAYVMAIDASLGNIADVYAARRKSPVLLCEDHVLLTPHVDHEIIEKTGLGQFSLWSNGLFGTSFVFSSTDNSDPNTNGRRYAAVSETVDLAPFFEHTELLPKGLAEDGFLASAFILLLMLAHTFWTFSRRTGPAVSSQ
jgi:hypothetical protein